MFLLLCVCQMCKYAWLICQPYQLDVDDVFTACPITDWRLNNLTTVIRLTDISDWCMETNDISSFLRSLAHHCCTGANVFSDETFGLNRKCVLNPWLQKTKKAHKNVIIRECRKDHHDRVSAQRLSASIRCHHRLLISAAVADREI